MKIRENYKVRSIAGENLVVSQGQAGCDMTQVISLNQTAFLLWKELVGKEFEIGDAAKVLTDNYGILREQALKDAQKWVDKLIQAKVIDA
ncbi:PqqD family protein [Oscillospiraceae bacterium N12]|jgi:hypothetical protein|uniref:PqqD family protein n=1 Tax=Jilunia laotingensis TaxID=2763675 RepID=A0A926EXQ9_9BACT|nr:PqqD family protein [Jilunia laotingensis]MBC8591843.1 PqqD family protein [Jilunia laotingensis]